MTTWTLDELRRIGVADELHIAAARDDGTYVETMLAPAARAATLKLTPR
jgi:hypothetical protein